jgi:hypothetical protein
VHADRPGLRKKTAAAAPPSRSLLDGVELVPEQLVHGEHVDLVLLEDGVQLIVAEDLAFVAGVLEVVTLDIVPELLDYLRAG